VGSWKAARQPSHLNDVVTRLTKKEKVKAGRLVSESGPGGGVKHARSATHTETPMKIPSILLTMALLCFTVSAGDFQLQLKTRTVYIVPMANGLNSHIASRLTSSGVVRVVLEPESAEAVLTDRVDEAFWAWSTMHYKAAGKNSNVALRDDDRFRFEHLSIGPYRGTLFLVDPRNGLILWSVYEPTPNTASNALDLAAAHIAASLKKSLVSK
jgi:hypothetical protein